jgi:hypothetical protein
VRTFPTLKWVKIFVWFSTTLCQLQICRYRRNIPSGLFALLASEGSTDGEVRQHQIVAATVCVPSVSSTEHKKFLWFSTTLSAAIPREREKLATEGSSDGEACKHQIVAAEFMSRTFRLLSMRNCNGNALVMMSLRRQASTRVGAGGSATPDDGQVVHYWRADKIPDMLATLKQRLAFPMVLLVAR